MSVRDLQWRRRRFVIALLATGLIFAMSLLMSGSVTGLRNADHRIIDLIGADSWIVATGAAGPFTASTAVPAAAADAVAALPGVTKADPVALLHSTARLPNVKDVNVIGYRSGGLASPKVSSGRTVTKPGETVADTKLKLKVGQEITLGGHPLRVVGLASKVTYYFGTPTLFVDLADAQAIYFAGQPLAMAIVTKGVPAPSAFVPAGLSVITPTQARADLARLLKSSNQTIGFLNGLLWVVAAGIIGSIVYLSVLERTRDFAVLKATGASNRALLGGLAIQAVILSALAAVVAALLAPVLAKGFPFAVEITLRSYVTMLVVALTVGLLASLAGLRRAVTVDPALAFGGG
ncbi:MAG: ABC transporter permease [Actinobacteria bacterium]|nr:ABC transporter permease [Actinomycetota bacterium]